MDKREQTQHDGTRSIDKDYSEGASFPTRDALRKFRTIDKKLNLMLAYADACSRMLSYDDDQVKSNKKRTVFKVMALLPMNSDFECDGFQQCKGNSDHRRDQDVHC